MTVSSTPERTSMPSTPPDAVPVANFEGKYLIDPIGRIWNLGRNVWQAQTQNPNGYFKVQLRLNGRSEQLLVHRLVALHFIPNPYQHPQVNHVDGNKGNNTRGNLEWVSREENIQHSLETGLRKGFMSLDQKAELVDRVLGGELIRDLAATCGRKEESLSGMLRRAADRLGKREAWNLEMQRRRRNVAIRNLEAINSKDT